MQLVCAQWWWSLSLKVITLLPIGNSWLNWSNECRDLILLLFNRHISDYSRENRSVNGSGKNVRKHEEKNMDPLSLNNG